MNEQTRIRLGIITARYGPRLEDAAREAESRMAERRASFTSAFERMRDEVLRPAMEDIGRALDAAGHGHAVDIEPIHAKPGISFHVRLRGARPGAANVIRLLVNAAKGREAEIIAEVALYDSPMEITRFQRVEEVTQEVAEHLLVEAIEQIFAWNA